MATSPFHPFTMDTGAQPGVSYAGMPPEMQQQAADIARKRAIQEAMMGQAFSPIQSQTTPQGRVVPTGAVEVISKLLQGGMAGKFQRQNTEATNALGQQYQSGLAQAVKDYTTDKAGVPGERDPQELQQNADLGTQLPFRTPPADPKTAATNAIMKGYGPLTALASKDYEHALKKEDLHNVAPGTTVLQDGKPIFTAAQKPQDDKSIPANWADQLPPGAVRHKDDPPGSFRLAGTDGQLDVYHGNFEGGKLVGYHKMDSSTRVTTISPPAMTTSTITDPKDRARSIVVDARTFNRDKYLAGDNTGVVGESPKLGDEAKASMKRQLANQGVGDAIIEARDILTGKGGRELPTHSGAGSLIDKGAAFFGKTPAGAKSADQLKVAGGMLVSRVPRFEGPQSNKDVDYYKSVAGRIGDDTLPIDRRLSALDEVENIWGQFEGGKKRGFFQLSSPVFNPNEEAEYQAWKAKQTK